MAAELTLRGVYVPLITPFASDGSVAIDAVESLTRHYLDEGATGIVALGTTAESSALDPPERRAVVETVSRVCVERDAQLVVGVGSNNTSGTIDSARELEATPGVVGALVVVPYYVRPSEAGIVAHFREVAAASPVPIVMYNVGARTGRHLSASAVLELAREANVAGIKQAAPFDADTLTLLAGARSIDGFSVLGGEDPYLFPIMLMGGDGAICASAHVCTRRFVDMIECGLAGKVEEGRTHAEALLPVIEACFAEPNPAVFKAALHAEGLIPTPDVRLPLVNASYHVVERALAAIAAAS